MKRQCRETKGCKAESSYSSTKRMVPHCGGIEPVMMLRLRSLFESARQSYWTSPFHREHHAEQKKSHGFKTEIWYLTIFGDNEAWKTLVRDYLTDSELSSICSFRIWNKKQKFRIYNYMVVNMIIPRFPINKQIQYMKWAKKQSCESLMYKSLEVLTNRLNLKKLTKVEFRINSRI